MHTSRAWRAVAVALALCAAHVANAQALRGTVTETKGGAIAHARVSLSPIHLSAYTDSSGRFAFPSLEQGRYEVEVSAVGHADKTMLITIGDTPVSLAIELDVASFVLPALTVTGAPVAVPLQAQPQPVTVLEGRELDESRAGSLGTTLANLPGVSAFARGSFSAKPVIRGLSGSRVQIAQDGQRNESQSWDEEQSPEIDPFDAQSIEVLRGPGSVLYGSDAIGGVVNIVSSDVPSAAAGAPTLDGVATLNAFSNTMQGAGSLGLEGASGWLGYRGHVTYRNAGNYHTPDSAVGNTDENELDASAMFATRPSWGTVTLGYTHFGQEWSIHPSPFGNDTNAEPFQQIGDDRVNVHARVPAGNIAFDADVAAQHNTRKEFETRAEGDPDAAQAMVDFALTTLTTDLRAHYHAAGSLFESVDGTVGVTYSQQRNVTSGIVPLIPGYAMRNFGAFFYEELSIKKHVTVTAGGRYDTRSMDVDGVTYAEGVYDTTLNVAAQTRSYNAVSGTVGVAWQIAEPFVAAINAGRGWRAPSIGELYINGPDEGVVRYKIGDSTLTPETSLNLDLSLRYMTSDVRAELSVYRNAIDDYIYLSPIGKIDAATGYPMYHQHQGNAALFGGEFLLRASVLSWLVVEAQASIVRGELDSANAPLPLVPADRGFIGARLLGDRIAGIDHTYLRFGVTAVADQNKIAPFETPTGGYALVNAGIGGDIAIASTSMHVDLGADNLLNRRYIDHLSRYKPYGIANPGVDVSLRVSVPFGIVR